MSSQQTDAADLWQIARSWWNSDGYRAFFRFLDEEMTGFFSERWGACC